MSNFPGKTFFCDFFDFLIFFLFLFWFLGPRTTRVGASAARIWRTSPLDRLVPYSLASAGAQERRYSPAQVLPQALPRIELETNVVPQLCFGALLPHTALSNNGAAKRKCSRMRNAEKKSERLALAYHTILYTILYYILYYTILKALPSTVQVQAFSHPRS